MNDISKSLLKGVEEALAHAKGSRNGAKEHEVYVPDEIDVKSIREHLKLSRSEFSRQFGFNVRTLEKWEQGVRHPDTATRAYLTVIASSPNKVISVLRGQP